MYSDNWAVLSAIGKGKGPKTLQPLRSEVLALAQDKDMALRVAYAERTRRHMRYAHDLANAARRGEWREREQLFHQPAEISLELREGGTLARLALRRSGERVTAEVPLSPLDTLPPSAQALLAAVKLAQSGETLRVRRASKLARALWDNPQRSLLPEAQAKL